ncbi:hypothetical protein MA16_Dca024077 [Dendrobium catenatum]|uniref:Uncharacterized protein n=1 Tax=Dendrobium catenatum TaxID=906689 RepID=A0A2I0VQU4_9ASPA|nr:hypothetical protein MA16_Dca024077 [Dendrobium catenatum]
MKNDREIPFILGSHFLATGKAKIDLQKGELTVRIYDQKVTIDVLKFIKFPQKRKEDCFIVDLEDVLAEYLNEKLLEGEVIKKDEDLQE